MVSSVGPPAVREYRTIANTEVLAGVTVGAALTAAFTGVAVAALTTGVGVVVL